MIRATPRGATSDYKALSMLGCSRLEEEGVRIAVMGSGGVGGFFGAKLARGGADVNFVARGAHLAAMREHGLAIESTDESFS